MACETEKHFVQLSGQLGTAPFYMFAILVGSDLRSITSEKIKINFEPKLRTKVEYVYWFGDWIYE